MTDRVLDTALPKTFADWWGLAGEWIEPPNQRRGGWSGVQYCVLNNRRYYIKKQCNHTYLTLGWPIRRPTVGREYRSIERLAKLGVPTPEPVFFGEQRSDEGLLAILVTAELSGFAPLSEQQDITPRQRTMLAEEAGSTVARFHRASLQHRALYDKHIMVRWPTPDSPEIALLDLEGMRFVGLPFLAARRDLAQLHRRQAIWGDADWEVLLRSHAQAMQGQ